MSRALALAVLLVPAPAFAEVDVVALIETGGLRAAEAELAALPAPSPTEAFALGGVRFLAGVERALQTRYTHGMDEGLVMMTGLPVLRLPIPENPTPTPFAPEVLEEMFAGISADMEGAVTVLEGIGDGDAVGLEFPLAAIWFDIDGDGQRQPGEGLAETLRMVAAPELTPDALPTVRFDTADAAWLAAYAHLLGGLAEIALALDPAEAVGRVLGGRDALAEVAGPVRDPLGMGLETRNWIDLAAIVLTMLDGVPDADHSRAAHAHLLDMVRQNRLFWDRVARETDNEAEWIPNKAQVSVLPLPFPEDIGLRWRAVLDDMEAALTGARLIPYWRLPEGAGLNLQAIFTDPPDMDLIGLIQGWSLAPYAQRGPRISDASLRAFERIVGGNTVLYALILN